MTPSFLIAQGIGIVAILLAFFVYTTKKRVVLISMKFLTDLLWGLHYLLLGAYSGALMNLVNMIREVIFQCKTSKKWAGSPVWAVVFIGMSLFSTTLSWQGPVSILPALGSSIAVIGLWCSDTAHIRAFSFPGVFLWLIYSILIKSYTHMISNLITLVSIGIGICRDIRDRKRA
ncbi:MAG: YgjV family protein [Clostridia bacterium]|nr:YgjV family protein [Clostridia bacterium]